MSRRRTSCITFVALAVVAVTAVGPAAASGRAAPRTGSAVPTIADPGGDVPFAAGDIVDHALTYAADGTIVVQVTTAAFEPLTSTNWRDGATAAFWDLDVNADQNSDFYASLTNEGGTVVGGVYRVVDDSLACSAIPSSDAAARQYAVTFTASCIGSPNSVAWYSSIAYDDVASGADSLDQAPTTGWAGPVVRATPTTPPTTTPGPIPPPACSPSSPNPAPSVAGGYASMVPARLLDTRPGYATIDCASAGAGPVVGGSVVELQVTGRAGIPADATAAVLNVAVTEAQAPGFVTAFPCGEPRPIAANLNYLAGSTVPNLVVAKIGAGGKVCLAVTGTAEVIADVNGFYPAGSSYVPVSPQRLLDTRPGYPGAQTAGDGVVGLAAGSVTELQVAGLPGMPVGATALTLNVAVVDPVAAGFLTLFPCGEARPNAANLNYVAGQVVSNAVMAKLGANGRLCVYTYAATHLAIDVNGYFPVGASYVPTVPARFLDTRAGYPTVDGAASGSGRPAAGSVTELLVAGRNGIPANVSAVVLNVAVVDAVGAGFVTVFPCGNPRPNAANLNYAVGQTVPNAVIAQVGANGAVCLYLYGAADLVVDVNGFFTT